MAHAFHSAALWIAAIGFVALAAWVPGFVFLAKPADEEPASVFWGGVTLIVLIFGALFCAAILAGAAAQ